MTDYITSEARLFFIHCSEKDYMVLTPEGRYAKRLAKREKTRKTIKALKRFLSTIERRLCNA